MRRHLLLAAAVSPILVAAVAASAPGCGTEEFENICGFLKDPKNCYATFHAMAGERCGTLGESQEPTGTFASRDNLDVCFLSTGGQVVFDPPLDPAAFPPKSFAFKRLDAQAQECGSFTFSGEFSYSVTINACKNPGEDAGEGGDAGADLPQCADGSGAGEGITSVSGGTVAITTPEGRATLDVSCADGTSHHFNRIDAKNEECKGHAALLPRAELQVNLGTQPPPDAGPSAPDTFAGFIAFRVHYPPINPSVDADGGVAPNESPEVVEYFNCKIPPPPALCFNGQKDGLETDVDCGGTLCPKPCGEGQFCVRKEDCASGSCARDTDGFSKCAQAGTGGAGGTDDASGAGSTGSSGGADDTSGSGGTGG
jgi:hypothetical protein